MIEHQLEAMRRKVPRTWWMPYAVAAGALALGFLASRVPVLKLVGVGARTVQTGLAVAGTVAAVDRFLAERRRGHQQQRAA